MFAKSFFRLLFLVPVVSLMTSPPVSAVESLAGIESIQPPLALEFASPVNADESFGFEIQGQGFDLLMVMPDTGQAAHYSMQRNEFTNFFDRTSDSAQPTERFAYHFGPEKIFKISGDTFDEIDRFSGKVSERANPFTTPTAVVQFGDVLVAMQGTYAVASASVIKGYRLDSEELLYEKKPPLSGYGYLVLKQDGSRGYALSHKKIGVSFSDDVTETFLECFELTSGRTIFSQAVSLAFLDGQSQPRLSIVPFAVGFGVVAIGDVDELQLFDAFTGESKATHALNGRGRSFSIGAGSLSVSEGTYFPVTRKGGGIQSRYSGAIALGEDRIYLQDEKVREAKFDSPGIAVFDFDFNPLFEIPNPYLAEGNPVANDFGGEMKLVSDRLVIGNRRYLRSSVGGQSRLDADPRVFVASFTSRDGEIFPTTRNVYLSESSFEVSENASLEFEVILNRAATEEVMVRVRPIFIVDDEPTATATLDFPTSLIDLTFAPGETTKRVSIPIIDDDLVEPNEVFEIVLTNLSSNVETAQPTTRVTIISDDFGPGELIRLADLDVKERYPDAEIGDVLAGDGFLAVGVPSEDLVVFYEEGSYEFLNTANTDGSLSGSFGEGLDSDGTTVAIGAPLHSGGSGKVFVYEVDPATGASRVGSVFSPVTVGGSLSKFGERVRIQGDLLAVSALLTPPGEPALAEGWVCLYRQNPTDPSDWEFLRAVTSPQTAMSDGTRNNRNFGRDFDFGPANLVILHENAQRILVPSGEGAFALAPSQSDVYLFDLSDFDAAPQVLSRSATLADIFLGDALRAGETDFVWVDANDNEHVLLRYSYAGQLLNTDIQVATAPFINTPIVDLAYNGALALRATRGTRTLDVTFSGDNSTADYALGEPFLLYQSALNVGFATRGGLDSRTSAAAISPHNPFREATGLTFDMSDDLLVAGDRGISSSQVSVYRLPSEVQVSAESGSINEGATLAESRGNVTFTLSEAAASEVVVFFETLSESATVREQGGSALASDVFTLAGSVTIPAGATSGTAEVQLIVDDEFEGPETFQIVITGVRGAGIRDRISTITILDDETELDLPVASIADVTFNEPDNFRGQISNGFPLVNDAELTVSLSEASAQDVVVAFELQSSDATFSRRLRQVAFATLAEPGFFGKDYTTPRYGRDTNGDFSPDLDEARFAYQVLIPAGQTSAVIAIPVANDGEPEATEEITVRLLSAKNARLAAVPEATLTLTDDDTTEISPLSITNDPDFAFSPGSSLDVSGGTLIVGNNNGEIVVSDLDGANRSLLGPPESGNNFGLDVAIEGDFVLAGGITDDDVDQIGTAYLFDLRDNSVRTLVPTTSPGLFFPRFGAVVEMASAGGVTAALTGSGNSRLVFVFDAATGDELRVIQNPGAPSFSSALSAEGSAVLAGSFGGGAYLFDWTNGNQIHYFANDGYGTGFGATVHLTNSHVLVGDDDANTATSPASAGVVAVYDRANFSLLYELTPPIPAEDNFGQAVTVAGSVIAVKGDEGTHLFALSDGTYLRTLNGNARAIAGNGEYLYLSIGRTVERYLFTELLGGSSAGFEGWLIANPELAAGLSSQLDPYLAYILGLSDQSSQELRQAATPSLFNQNQLSFRVDVPTELPVGIRLEVIESSDLENWNCVGFREGRDAWTFLRPQRLLQGATPDRQRLEIQLAPGIDRSRYYALQAVPVSE